jgi:hypothetical protein
MKREASDDDDNDGCKPPINDCKTVVDTGIATRRCDCSSKLDHAVWAFLFVAGLLATVYSKYQLVYT